MKFLKEKILEKLILKKLVTQDSGLKLRYVTQFQARSETALRNAVSDLNPGASNADLMAKLLDTSPVNNPTG